MYLLNRLRITESMLKLTGLNCLTKKYQSILINLRPRDLRITETVDVATLTCFP